MTTAKTYVPVRLTAEEVAVIEAIQAKFSAMGIDVSQGRAVGIALKAWGEANGVASSSAQTAPKPAKAKRGK